MPPEISPAPGGESSTPASLNTFVLRASRDGGSTLSLGLPDNFISFHPAHNLSSLLKFKPVALCLFTIVTLNSLVAVLISVYFIDLNATVTFVLSCLD